MDAPANRTAWVIRAFDELTPRELHDILRLRSGIFQLEQNCLYADIDGRDMTALHVFGLDPQGGVVAAARIFLPGTVYDGQVHDDAWIGRVVVAATVRGRGLGHALMRAAIAETRRRAPGATIALSAQAHLQSFYAAHGFRAVGDPYEEDNIPHVEMRLT
jgi:ElaA protein